MKVFVVSILYKGGQLTTFSKGKGKTDEYGFYLPPPTTPHTHTKVMEMKKDT